jgi:hypothetical protein
MNLKEIYNQKKHVLDNAYAEAYSIISLNLDNDEDFYLDTDTEAELIHDLMLSNMLGEVITHDELMEMQKKAEAYDKLIETNPFMQ